MAWEPSDRAKLTAHLLEEGERCSMCGTQRWEWQEDRRAYEPAEDVCMGCYMRDVFMEGEKEKKPGQRVILVPRAHAERMRAEQV
jgi:hypothetical protein